MTEQQQLSYAFTVGAPAADLNWNTVCCLVLLAYFTNIPENFLKVSK